MCAGWGDDVSCVCYHAEGGETMDASCKQEVENASRPEALTPTEENVPQSLTEIYRLRLWVAEYSILGSGAKLRS